MHIMWENGEVSVTWYMVCECRIAQWEYKKGGQCWLNCKCSYNFGKYNLEKAEKWYVEQPSPVTENERAKILWYF